MGLAGIRDYFFPINPVTERREIHLIPSRLEKFVGASSYAPLIVKSGGEVTEWHSKDKYQYYVRLVKEVGEQLAAHAKRKDLEFEFTVIDSQENNAWCLPGGKIGINVGLIEKIEKEELPDTSLPPLTLKEKIAAVLSHEIVHADARHTGRALEFRLFLIGIIKATHIFLLYRLVTLPYDAKIAEARNASNAPLVRKLTAERDFRTKILGLFDTLSSWMINGITLCSSRSHELESDRFGMRMIRDVSRAQVEGFIDTSPQAAIWLQHFFQKEHSHKIQSTFLKGIKNFFSTHPSPEVRLLANRQTWEDLQAKKL